MRSSDSSIFSPSLYQLSYLSLVYSTYTKSLRMSNRFAKSTDQPFPLMKLLKLEGLHTISLEFTCLQIVGK